MKKKAAEQLLKYMIAQLLMYLDELADCSNVSDEQFVYGEKTAYIECLEWIQLWEYAEIYGLNFDIEKHYPL